MPLLNYTTKVPATRSISEIQKALIKSGARSIQQDFDDNGDVVAVAFQIPVPDPAASGQFVLLSYRLPAEIEPVGFIMQHDPAVPRAYKTPEQARRVAWRILKDWIEAQMAIIEARMVTLPQVMLPYATDETGKTLWENVAANPRLLLGGGQ